MRKKVLIVGLGLIGGSLAKAIRAAHDVDITGYDTNQESLIEAKSLGIIDHYTAVISDSAKAADFILLAAPVNSILEHIELLSKIDLKPGVIITDVGSTKRQIVNKAANVFQGRCTFIGGHPMAGSHKSGVSASQPNLFENAYYFIVPDTIDKTKEADQLQTLLKGTHAKFITVTPDKHDDIVGIISHFPHLIASGLVHHLKEHPEQEFNLRNLAAGGFRDITRIASADPVMWQDIISNNSDIMLKLFHSWEEEMGRIKTMLMSNDRDQIKTFFSDAKAYRDGFPQKEKGAIPAYYDLYADIPDQPLAISDITRLIGEADLNLTNINIIELRENIFGVLRLSFPTLQQREQAMAVLSNNNYKTYLND
ncbi:prephenate dehydrogenase [Scopulibacillus darangshiensis]|uniref:Prephenate dehydrogenase n=1 Tax=Scopulibacillus darangshiensis TaxID=442528 RepID=A0A4R2P9D8_9BACL|nr:prephenate dehydrogenase [Scopulibacillus darangshiensis]TCP31633.1 prephenate dehydrogenase [Scopulibacillus darangshiensis]